MPLLFVVCFSAVIFFSLLVALAFVAFCFVEIIGGLGESRGVGSCASVSYIEKWRKTRENYTYCSLFGFLFFVNLLFLLGTTYALLCILLVAEKCLTPGSVKVYWWSISFFCPEIRVWKSVGNILPYFPWVFR